MKLGGGGLSRHFGEFECVYNKYRRSKLAIRENREKSAAFSDLYFLNEFEISKMIN